MNNADMIDLERLMLILRRHIPLICMTIILFVAPAAAYVLLTAPEYTAQTSLLLDRRATATVSDASSLKEMGFEDSSIESEVEVIRSRRVIDEVINSLVAKGYYKDIYDVEGKRDMITQKLQSSTQVSRVGGTYVLSIENTSRDPVQAADTANAFADAYIREQISALSETSIRTTAWLASKLEELRSQTTDAQKAVSEFRAKYNVKAQRQRAGGSDDGKNADFEGSVGLSELRNLEKKAETYGDLYNSYVERLSTISMQQALPVTETRIITRAIVPENKSHPKTAFLLGVAAIIGTGLGILIAVIRDNADRTLKRGGQIKREIGVSFLGFLPRLVKEKTKTSLKLFSAKGAARDVIIGTESVDNPIGAYSIVIRTLMNTADQAIGTERKKVIGIISADAGKGKSIVASNLAVFAAQSARCLLIDADIRSSAKSYGDGAGAGESGLEDILVRNAPLDQVILSHKEDGLSFLPRSGRDVHSALLHLNAGKVKGLLETCKKHYDIVIVDCPPLTEPSEVYGFAQAVDCFIIVAEWGKTQSNSLNFHIRQNGIPAEKILGVVLDNTDTARMVKHYGYKVPA